MLVFSLLLVCFTGIEDKPQPKLPIGRETTYVTGPLDKDGYIEYDAALNARLSNGITPDQNANVLIWKALGPRPESESVAAEYFKALGISPPPEKGDYLLDFKSFAKDQQVLRALEDQLGRAIQRPWTAKECPELAAWLISNDKPLAVVIEASKRRDYFNPLVAPHAENETGVLIGARLPSVQKCRTLAGALAARAMLQCGDRRFDEAWQDLMACHRLGRLVGRGASLIEALVGIAVEQVARTAELAYLERAPLDGERNPRSPARSARPAGQVQCRRQDRSL